MVKSEIPVFVVILLQQAENSRGCFCSFHRSVVWGFLEFGENQLFVPLECACACEEHVETLNSSGNVTKQ